jgi:hypothetical protein
MKRKKLERPSCSISNTAAAIRDTIYFNPAPGLQEVHGDRVAQGIDGAAGDACLLRVVLEELLHHPLLERPFPAGEEIGARGLANPEVRARGLGRVAPQGPLPPDTVRESADPDAMLLEVEVVDGEVDGFIDA